MKMTGLLVFAALLAGCGNIVEHKEYSSRWHTLSNMPEEDYPDVSVAEVNTAMKAEMALRGYALISSNDFGSQFQVLEAPILGVVWMPGFAYTSMSGKVRVTARPRIQEKGAIRDAKTDEEITNICSEAMDNIAPRLMK